MQVALPEDRVWNVNQAAQYLGCKASTLYKKVSKREVPFVKVGGALRFRKAQLDEFLEKNSVKVGAA